MKISSGKMTAAIIPITSIEVGERARQDPGDLTDIEESASTFMGQIQSIAVKELGDGRYRLLGGGRRLLAFAKVGVGEVLARIYPSTLSEAEEKEIELTENVARLEMGWMERAALVKRIHDLQVSIKGEKAYPTDEVGWSQGQTAEKVGRSPASVSRDIALAEAVETVPELRECKTRKEAENLLNKMEEKLLVEELARREEEKSASTPIELQRATLVASYKIGDATTEILTLPENSFDVVILDPPYGIAFTELEGLSTCKREDSKYNKADFVDIPASEYQDLLDTTLDRCMRVTKDNAWFLCWFSIQTYQATLEVLQSYLKVAEIPGIWVKNVHGANADPSHYLPSQYEPFFYARKGAAVIRQRGHTNTFHFDRPGGERTHPTEKPVELTKAILEVFSFPGARVLSPFLGSGNDILAAHAAKMACVGFDLSEPYRNAFVLKVREFCK